MPTLSSPPLPFTLSVSTPADGFTLARRLAEALVAATHAAAGSAATMPHFLQTQAANRPSLELVAAIYFHAISIANDGWRE